MSRSPFFEQKYLISHVVKHMISRIVIRPICADDKDLFMRIQQENSEMSRAYEEPHFYDSFWKDNLNSEDDIYMMVLQKEDGRHIGNCSFQDAHSDEVVIGIDIDKAVQNQGIGTAVLSVLVEYLRQNAPEKKYLIKTKSNNLRCQRMIEKVGGVKVGEERTEFDRTMDHFLPTLKENGMTEAIEKTIALMDCNNGICVNVYEFRR